MVNCHTMFNPWILLFLLSEAAFSQSKPLGLDESYQLALKKNQSVSVQNSTVERAREQKSQANGAILPTISAIGSHSKQDVSNLTTSNSIRENTTSARLSLAQPLFRGFREYAGMRSAAALIEKEELSLSDEKAKLYKDLAEAFYQTLIYKSEEEKIKKLLDLTDKRVSELRKRTSVGRTRRGELLTAQSQAASLRAQVATNKGLLEQSIATLEVYTGVKSPRVTDTMALPDQVPPITNFISRIEDRPDINAAVVKAEIADEGVEVAKGAHWPSLDLGGNYYLKREGTLENSKWDATLTLTLPLFEGGVTQSKVRESSQVYFESQKTLEQNREAAFLEITRLHQTASQGLEEIKAYKEAVELAEVNFKEQSKDYRFGLTTNLEVLQALNSYVDLERNLDRKTYLVKTALAQLKAATGDIQ
jgi:outer membrane protein